MQSMLKISQEERRGKKYPASFLPLLFSILPVFPIGWTYQEATGQEILAKGTLRETEQSMEKVGSEDKLAVDQQPLFPMNMKYFAYKCKQRWELGETYCKDSPFQPMLFKYGGGFLCYEIVKESLPSFQAFFKKWNLSVNLSLYLHVIKVILFHF